MPSGNDANAKLLLHCNGADTSTTFTDDSASARTVSVLGNAQIDTAQSKFGGASGLFDGSGDYLTVPDSNDWAFGTNPFTIDFWVRFNSISGIKKFITQGTTDNYWELRHREADNRVFFSAITGGSFAFNFRCSWTPAINTWYHIALVRIDNGNAASSWRIFINGVSQTLTLDNGAWNASIGNYAGVLYISKGATSTDYINGWLDELRISDIARWTSNFTPPTEEYDVPSEELTENETVTLSENFNLQVNPDSQSINESLSLSEDWELLTNPELLDINEAISLSDNWELALNAEELFENDTVSLSDDWELLTNPEVVSWNDNISLSELLEFGLSYKIPLNLDLRWLQTVTKNISVWLSWLKAQFLNTDFRWFSTTSKTLSTDFRWLTDTYTILDPINQDDIQILINGYDVALNNDVDLLTGNITHTIGQQSRASCVLARRHDDLDRTHTGLASEITNQNPIQIYIDGHLEFDGYISNINVNSENENVTIQAIMEQPTDNRHTIELPLPSIDEKLHLYHCLVNSVQVDNPKQDTRSVIIGSNNRYWTGSAWNFYIENALTFNTDAEAETYVTNLIASEESITNEFDRVFTKKSPSVTTREKNPQYYKGIKCDLGKQIQQQVDKYRLLEYIIDGKGMYATQIEDGTFVTKLNYSYFWAVLAKNALTGIYNGDYRYIGTSLASTTTDLWVLNGVVPMYQKIKDNLETELGYYYLGSAPYKEISPKNGILIPAHKWQDRNDGLYSVLDESYNYVPYAKEVARLEYEKLKNVHGDILPVTSANLEVTFDAYYYYNIKLLTRINVTNTTISDTYKNLNGFPVSVKGISINFNTMKISLSTDNRLSQKELDELDTQMPDDESSSYMFPEQAVRVYRKFNLQTWQFVS